MGPGAPGSVPNPVTVSPWSLLHSSPGDWDCCEDEVERMCLAWTGSAEGAFSSPSHKAWNLPLLSSLLLIGFPASIRLAKKFHFYLNVLSG